MHGKHVAASGAAFAVPAAVVPAALAGAMAVSALAGPDVAPPAGHGSTVTAVLDARIDAPQPVVLTAKAALPAARESYTVVTGDTLSGIAGRFCGSQGKWPSLYRGNHGVIGADPDLIMPGQKFTLSCGDSPLYPVVTQAAVQPAVQPAVSQAPVQQVQQQAPVQQPAAIVTGASGTIGGGYPGGSFGACVVARESGGNSQVMNSTGHYGLYQFSESTWEEYGGSPADFGNASPAEQEQVFSNAMATPGGASNWSPYDGC